jgi:hypothetical protein
MSRRHHRKQRFKLRSLYVWHRYMGLGAALVAVLVAITGILLNHTEDFDFDSRHVQADWILDWYGIEPPEDLLSFPLADRHVTLMGEHLYLDRKEIDGEYRDLVGAVLMGDIFVVAVSNSILLLTPRGELIERLRGEDGVPAGMKRIGTDAQGALVVEGSHVLYRADSDFLRWQHADSPSPAIRWARPGTLEPQLKLSLQNHFRGEVLPVERLILDLHSGRFFGRLGPWVVDAAAVLITLLALSGTWIWLKRRR